MTLVCVLNLSEGRQLDVIDSLATAAGEDLLDVHHDADHHRSVLTVVGEEAPRRIAEVAVAALDLRTHAGAHPRQGVVDVIPFIPLTDTPMASAVAARDRFAHWIGTELGVPAFLYGPDGPSLPEVRRQAFADLAPFAGPATPHPRAGAAAVGARGPLVAYNLWLAEPDLDRARSIVRSLRSPAVRALALVVGDRVQVSCNLVDPLRVGPDDAYDAVAERANIERAELVGLIPAAVLAAISEARWPSLDLDEECTFEARLARRNGARSG